LTNQTHNNDLTLYLFLTTQISCRQAKKLEFRHSCWITTPKYSNKQAVEVYFWSIQGL